MSRFTSASPAEPSGTFGPAGVQLLPGSPFTPRLPRGFLFLSNFQTRHNPSPSQLAALLRAPLVLASSSLRGKKELLEQFLRQAEPDHLRTPSDSLEHFHSFASKQLAEEAMHIVSKPLHGLPLKREPTLAYLKKSCEAGVASAIGEDLPACLPPMRRNDPRASLLRNDLLLIASNFVNKFAGVPWTFNT